jgi:hypothetical protein
MSWFQRHLNWSLLLGIVIIPMIVWVIIMIIFGLIVYSGISGIAGPSEEYLQSLWATMVVPFYIIYFLLLIAQLVYMFFVTCWYLGQKARSKWLSLLIFAPFGLIILLLLENQAIDYGGDLADELSTNSWQDTGPFSTPDDRQYKELDYTPTQNVLDIAGGGPATDVRNTSDVSKAVDSGTVKAGGEEAPEPEKVVQSSVSQQRLQMPILLDDSGAPMSCFYHPGADAVNMCSRCQKYVCIECNYITGTHPICHSCWDKRASIPVAPPEQKQVKPAPAKTAKQRGKLLVEPEKQKVVEVAQVEAQKITEPAMLEKQQVIEPTGSVAAPVAPVIAPAEPIEQKYVEPIKPEPQKIVAPAKAVKQEAEKIEWQQEFMALYEQASPIINAVTSKSPDGMPASPLDLMEGLKLRPMLELVKKLSKPKDKELRDAKSDLEKLMSNCIKIADAAANFISSGGQALLGGPDFKRIVDGIEAANGLLEKLSRRLTAFSHPQE